MGLRRDFRKFLEKHSNELRTVATVMEAAIDGSTMPDDKKYALKEATGGLIASAASIASYAAKAKAAGPNPSETRAGITSIAAPLISGLTMWGLSKILSRK